MKEWKRQGRQGANTPSRHRQTTRCPHCGNNDPAKIRQYPSTDKEDVNRSHYHCVVCHGSFDQSHFLRPEDAGKPRPVPRRNSRK